MALDYIGDVCVQYEYLISISLQDHLKINLLSYASGSISRSTLKIPPQYAIGRREKTLFPVTLTSLRDMVRLNICIIRNSLSLVMCRARCIVFVDK